MAKGRVLVVVGMWVGVCWMGGWLAGRHPFSFSTNLAFVCGLRFRLLSSAKSFN